MSSAEHGGLGSESVEGSLRILRRDIGGVLANGVGGWLLDFGPLNKAPEGWYSGEPIIKEIRGLMELCAHRPALDIRSEGEMCVLYDQQSFTATAHWLAGQPWEQYGIKSSDYFNHWFVNTQTRSMLRIGAPLNALFRFDLTRNDVQRYKMIFAVNAFLMSAEETRRMRRDAARQRYDRCVVLCTGVHHSAPSGPASDGAVDRIHVHRQ